MVPDPHRVPVRNGSANAIFQERTTTLHGGTGTYRCSATARTETPMDFLRMGISKLYVEDHTMKKSLLIAATPILLLAASASMAHDKHGNRVGAALHPTSEVPSVSSVARGSFKATIDEVNQTITYELTYDGLEGTVAQAHIHVGQPGVNGGVSVFLCGNAPTVPPATVPQPPACPTTLPATVTGVITPANIVGPAPQGVAASTATANEFAELVELLKDGVTYANVHSSKFQGGEIRGQIKRLVFVGHHDRE